MRKWPLLFAIASIIVIGCGGNGSGNGTTGTNGTNGSGSSGGTTRQNQGINFPDNPATLDVYFENGQGRLPTNYTAQIGPVYFTDTSGNSTNIENPEPPDIYLLLNGYNTQNRIISAHVPFPGSSESLNSRGFNDLQFLIGQFYINGTALANSQVTVDTTALGIPILVTGFPGRFTAIQVYLNDGMFDFTQTPPAFTTTTTGQTQFAAQNIDPVTNNLQGFLSDYLSFDISHVANEPAMTNFAGTGKRIFVSGDAFAVGQATPANANATSGFEVLTPFGVMPGTYQTTQAVVGVAPYTVTQPNPVLSFGQVGTITSLEGPWYDSSTRVVATDSTLMITFPGQGDTSTQQCVVIVRNGSTITNMYFGTVLFGSTTTYHVFPIANLENGSAAGEVSGTCTGFVTNNGTAVATSGSNWWQNVRAGTYSVTGGTGISAARFVVYRI